MWAVPKQETSIRFTLTGNQTVIMSYWSGAVKTGSLYTIVVTTTDPVAEMRRIRERLALIVATVQVVTQPYEIVLAYATTTLSTPEPVVQSDNTALIVVGIVVLVVVIVISLVIAFSVNHSNHSKHAYLPAPVQLRHVFYVQYRQVPVRVV